MLYERDSFEKFLNLKIPKWFFFLPFFGPFFYFKLFSLLIKYNKDFKHIASGFRSEAKYRSAVLFFLNIFTYLIVFVLTFTVIFRVFEPFKIEDNLKNIGFNGIFANNKIASAVFLNIFIYCLIIFSSFFVNLFFLKWLYFLLKRKFRRKYGTINPLNTFGFIKKFKFQTYLDNVFRKKFSYDKEKNELKTEILENGFSKRKYRFNGFLTYKNQIEEHYYNLYKEEKISEFELISIKTNIYFWPFAIVFAYVFEMNKKSLADGFRKKFNSQFSLILFFYYLIFLILIFIFLSIIYISYVYTILNAESLNNELTFSIIKLVFTIFGLLAVFLIWLIVNRFSIIIWNYFLIKKRFFEIENF